MESSMNNDIWFTLISLKKTSHFSLGGNPEDLGDHILELLQCFGANVDIETFQITVTSLLQNTELLRESINNYVGKHRAHSPVINKLNDFFKKLEDNEMFYFLPGVKELTQKQTMMTYNELMSLMDKSLDFDDINSRFTETFGEFLDKYTLEGVISDKKIKIGEGLKSKRICRFCNNKRQKNTTFNQEAHAISESMGNKTVVLNEECDACNKYFSETIERDIDTYFKTLTTFFKVKNKDNKVPKIKGKNFEFSHNSDEDGPDHVLIYTLPESVEGSVSSSPPDRIPLQFNAKVRMQNIYKAFVKFSLSVVDDKFLERFNKTINWISTDHFYQHLPKIALLKSYNGFSKGAELKLYLRKDNDTRLPYAVGEFQYTFLKYVFIIPTFDDNERDFTEEVDYQYFWDFFKFFHIESGWEYQNFSNSEEKDFVFNMVFKPNSYNNKNQADA